MALHSMQKATVLHDEHSFEINNTDALLMSRKGASRKNVPVDSQSLCILLNGNERTFLQFTCHTAVHFPFTWLYSAEHSFEGEQCRWSKKPLSTFDKRFLLTAFLCAMQFLGSTFSFLLKKVVRKWPYTSKCCSGNKSENQK